MLRDKNDGASSTDELVSQMRRNLQPPNSKSGSERRPLELVLLSVAVCLSAALGAVLAGIAAPLLIPGAIILLFVSFGSPNLVRRITSIWPISLLPGSYTADPVRFAAMFALLSIPISGIAGFAVYQTFLPGSANDHHAPPPASALVVSLAASPTEAVPTPTVAEPTPTTSEPTATPTRSAPTQVPATEVPPTSRPALPNMTADQQGYLADLYSKARIIDNTDDLFNQLVDQLSKDHQIIADPNWQKQMDTQLEIWRSLYEGSKDIAAPAGLEIVNGKWIEFLGHKNLAADKLSRGIEQLNSDLIGQGEDEMDTAFNLAQQLNTLLDKFMAQFDGQPNVQFN